jgi:hypothetical protein
MECVGTRVKDPDEVIPAYNWGVDWANDLNTGETVVSVTILVYDEADSSDVTTTLCPDVGVVSGGRYTTVAVTAGTDQHIYRIIHRAVTSDGKTMEVFEHLTVEANEP